MKVKLDEVLTGKAGEYREPLAALQRSMQIRTQVAGMLMLILIMARTATCSHLRGIVFRFKVYVFVSALTLHDT